MKCLQSCRRTKNIKVENGLYNVCNDNVKDTTKRLEDKKAIINILVQHEMIEILKQENKTSKVRIDSFEQWLNKQSRKL